MNRLSAMLRLDHIAETRLDELARAGAPVDTAAEPAELAHLSGCRRCRSLIVGFERTDSVLNGAWADRPLHRGAEIPAGADRVRLSPVQAGPSRRRTAIPALGAAVVVALVATAGLLSLRGSAVPSTSAGPSAGGQSAAGTYAGSTAPAVTAVVARIQIQNGVFDWAPDGAHLLVLDSSGSRVFNRDGKQVGTFGPNEGWLDAGHLIDGDGHVWALTDKFVPKSGDYPWYGPVVASGHGSAALIVAQPACEGDPIVDWYRDGSYDKAGEKVTVFGWSPDGKYVLKGHMDCTDQEAMLHGWQGHVDVVDFATGKVAVTVPGVRGTMAFNPSGTRLAAQSDANVVVGDTASGKTQTFLGFRFLGWLDDDRFYALHATEVDILDATSGAAPQKATPEQWLAPSGAGPSLLADTSLAAQRIVSADGSTLLDLSSSGLVTQFQFNDTRTDTSLQRRIWSPDGRMLALESSDGTTVVMLSVNPAAPGSVGTALPTPVSSAGVLSVEAAAPLPGKVDQLVADPARNSLWFLGGTPGGTIDLYRYDIGKAALQAKRSLAGTSFDAVKATIALSPSGQVLVAADRNIVVYDPGNGHRHPGDAARPRRRFPGRSGVGLGSLGVGDRLRRLGTSGNRAQLGAFPTHPGSLAARHRHPRRRHRRVRDGRRPRGRRDARLPGRRQRERADDQRRPDGTGPGEQGWRRQQSGGEQPGCRGRPGPDRWNASRLAAGGRRRRGDDRAGDEVGRSGHRRPELNLRPLLEPIGRGSVARQGRPRLSPGDREAGLDADGHGNRAGCERPTVGGRASR